MRADAVAKSAAQEIDVKAQEQARIKTEKYARRRRTIEAKARERAKQRQEMEIKAQERARIKRREARRKARRGALGSTRRKYGKLPPAALDTRLVTDARKNIHGRSIVIPMNVPGVIWIAAIRFSQEQIRLYTPKTLISKYSLAARL
ncbi:hypothetical protein BG011_002111 [Mortierella polycephala]|uniref:Uncharacterized protein n=1 Tax=Mortierella polycephala TaxID=41804 RepID=A0A9P6PK58_9FUNG|nr:hypothetical protein BG011_002111 [Mortierella polycephala]